VAEALKPAKPLRIIGPDAEGKLTVVVPQRELSLAIGREGQNVRLAAKLANVKIDITSDTEIDLSDEASVTEEAPA
jgi:N utilization substance protein A